MKIFIRGVVVACALFSQPLIANTVHPAEIFLENDLHVFHDMTELLHASDGDFYVQPVEFISLCVSQLYGNRLSVESPLEQPQRLLFATQNKGYIPIAISKSHVMQIELLRAQTDSRTRHEIIMLGGEKYVVALPTWEEFEPLYRYLTSQENWTDCEDEDEIRERLRALAISAEILGVGGALREEYDHFVLREKAQLREWIKELRSDFGEKQFYEALWSQEDTWDTQVKKAREKIERRKSQRRHRG